MEEETEIQQDERDPGGKKRRPSRGSVGLPLRPFLFTLDQLETMLGVKQMQLMGRHLYLDGIHEGIKPLDRMMAHNIAPEHMADADWRVSESELIRWLRHKGFFLYDRGWVLD